MKKYILYAHGGSGNHGCEALVRSTIALLDTGRDNMILVSERPEEDVRYGVDQFCVLKKKGCRKPPSKLTFAFVKAYLQLKLKNDFRMMDQLAEFSGTGARRGDIAISIGGDTYCYGGEADLIYLHRMWKDRGLKTVYWGCSIEPTLLENPKIAEDIRQYDLITARESISYEALKRVNPNTVLVVDSAFLLEKKEVSLPNGFEDCDLVGINVSPLIEKNEKIHGIVHENYEMLIEYILNQTDMKILLIPHVVWKHDDDRTVLNDLLMNDRYTGRIMLVEDCDCEILKGYISKCRFFIGARTHGSIAAYSMGIPTLVVGYSVKSWGIARDLFGSEKKYVLPVQNMVEKDDLVNAFMWLQSNEMQVRERLQSIMPEYKKRIDKGVQELKKL